MRDSLERERESGNFIGILIFFEAFYCILRSSPSLHCHSSLVSWRQLEVGDIHEWHSSLPPRLYRRIHGSEKESKKSAEENQQKNVHSSKISSFDDALSPLYRRRSFVWNLIVSRRRRSFIMRIFGKRKKLYSSHLILVSAASSPMPPSFVSAVETLYCTREHFSP